MAEDTPAQHDLGRYREAQRRWSEASQQYNRSERSPGATPEQTVAHLLLENVRRIVRSPGVHPDFQNELRAYLLYKSDGIQDLRFTSPDGVFWHFSWDPGTSLVLTKRQGNDYTDTQQLQAKYRNDFGQGETSLVRGREITEEDEMRRTRTRIEPTESITSPGEVGIQGFMLLGELEEALRHPYAPPPPEPPRPEAITREEIMEQHEPVEPPPRQALVGELTPDYNTIPTMYDFDPGRFTEDRESPGVLLSMVCAEADRWRIWHMTTPVVDNETGSKHRPDPATPYRLVTYDETGKEKYVEVSCINHGGLYGLRVRELEDTHGSALVDLGETTIYSGNRGAHSQWRAPGINNHQEPTAETDNGDPGFKLRKNGDPSINALTKGGRAMHMVRSGFVVGYTNPDGGFVPAHRQPTPR